MDEVRVYGWVKHRTFSKETTVHVQCEPKI